MKYNLPDIQIPLLINNVFEGDDVFVHGFNLSPNTTINDFANKLFKEGIKKRDASDSILSTIALMPHKESLDKSISLYRGRGNYRVIVKIPEEIEGLYLGKCNHCYGDSGNQYRINDIWTRNNRINPQNIH